jgi:hypothetical protein
MLPVAEHHHLPAPLLTPKALCAQLSICPRTYSRLVRQGLPCVWVLTARRYDLAEVTAWLRQRASVASTPPPRRRVWPEDDQLVRHLKLLARGRR